MQLKSAMPLNTTGLLPRVPVSCFWEVTEACNLRCLHCEVSAARAAPDELTTDEALKVADDLAALECENVCLTGGEPLLRRDWPVIAEKLHKLGMSVSVISNGVLLDESTINTLQDAGVYGLSVSLDGSRSVHDSIRIPAHQCTASSYDSAINAIRLGVSSRLKTAVITLVHRQNIGRLRETYEVLASLGVLVWQVQICMPLGRMLKHTSDLLIEPARNPRA